jgi:hypothetical protein
MSGDGSAEDEVELGLILERKQKVELERML